MLTLTEVRRQPEHAALRLTWSDGHSGLLSYHDVRGWCPCAGCQGHTAALSFHAPLREAEPAEIAPVGNYAISIRWSDGHATGIYRFDYLRDLCPCAACVERWGEPAPDRSVRAADSAGR